jgi:hypothetical protein
MRCNTRCTRLIIINIIIMTESTNNIEIHHMHLAASSPNNISARMAIHEICDAECSNAEVAQSICCWRMLCARIASQLASQQAPRRSSSFIMHHNTATHDL